MKRKSRKFHFISTLNVNVVFFCFFFVFFLFFFADDHPGLLKNLEPLTEYFDTIHNNRNYGYREHILLSIHWLNCSRQQYL